MNERRALGQSGVNGRSDVEKLLFNGKQREAWQGDPTSPRVRGSLAEAAGNARNISDRRSQPGASSAGRGAGDSLCGSGPYSPMAFRNRFASENMSTFAKT